MSSPPKCARSWLLRSTFIFSSCYYYFLILVNLYLFYKELHWLDAFAMPSRPLHFEYFQLLIRYSFIGCGLARCRSCIVIRYNVHLTWTFISHNFAVQRRYLRHMDYNKVLQSEYYFQLSIFLIAVLHYLTN